MISLVKITEKNFLPFQHHILEIENSSFPSPWTLHAFRQELSRVISQFWALTVDEMLAGYICFWIFAGEIHLMNIAVHPKMRRKGFGVYLLTAMIEVGKSRAIGKAWLEVRPSNVKAQALYRKMGFREIGRRPRYYTDTNEDAIIMSLHLFQKEIYSQSPGGQHRLQQVM
jgi:ribosomal-protein-alanine N-acetyltransferase